MLASNENDSKDEDDEQELEILRTKHTLQVKAIRRAESRKRCRDTPVNTCTQPRFQNDNDNDGPHGKTVFRFGLNSNFCFQSNFMILIFRNK